MNEKRERPDGPPPGTDSLPRSIEPERDLWPEIEGRIREGAGDAAPRRAKVIDARHLFGGKAWLAAAAVVALVLAGIGLGRFGGDRGGGAEGPDAPRMASAPTDSAQADTAPTDRPPLEPAPIDAALAGTPYATADGADSGLPLGLVGTSAADSMLAALDRKRDELDPATVEVLEANLKIIQEASASIRDALENDPGNARLKKMLSEEERRRGSVIRRAAGLLKII